MNKITAVIAAALLSSGAAMAQDSDFSSIVIDYGYAPGLSAKAAAPAAVAAAKPVVEQKAAAAKTRAEVVAELGNAQQNALARADAELGIIPAARKAPAATMLAGQPAKSAQ